ncbi:hypothetical protein PYH37_001590 [Sinorhizobium numidicum]|uniref:Uncharacterized protein n=1 Tax=Sinorhizobium numidicum TaxID=680248 RepID=A0ABY8CT51_9HYPH|nr:hypothetical protein [Sinorhizobium numidicum]WEX74201.1 hypothetical protein PYH37_001590 [Sinorhizobium numidicum]WEX80186.1 hypothetical protein PYH38_001591 [Sinorhizobium numidicum]
MVRNLKPVVMLIIAALALYGLQQSTPGYSEITSPVTIHGKAGTRVEGRDFAVGIANVHLARTVKTESFGRVRDYTTSGVWVLIEGAAVANRQSLTLTSAEWLGSSGIRYAISERFSTLPGYLITERLEPGLPKPVLLAFEVPQSELRGGTLLLARSDLMPLGEELRISIDDERPTNSHSTVMLARNQDGLAWTLTAE